MDFLPTQAMHIPHIAMAEAACSDDGVTDIHSPSTDSGQPTVGLPKKVSLLPVGSQHGKISITHGVLNLKFLPRIH
jgi:hypothetical protein